MNFTTQLSIKSALRFALPCIASCLLLTACSNEGSEMNPGDTNPAAPGSIRFMASAPLASDAATTRIGIGENKPDVTDESDWDRAEPVIWLEGDAVSVFFVPTAGGNPIHAKFVVEDGSISNGGKSAELVSASDFDPRALDGEYTIYAFSPYASTNTLNNMTLDLSSQTQAVNADATNYSHLGNTAYMRANAGDATFENGALTGGEVNLAFDNITSFLRFHIKNELGGFINVTDISLTHTFMSNTSTYSVATGSLTTTNLNETINLSFSGAGQPLYPNVEFDAYMSTFPVTHFGSESLLYLTVYYTDATGTQMITYPIPQSDLVDLSETACLFPKSSRFLFDIVLQPSDPASEYLDDLTHNGTTYTPIRWENLLVSPANYIATLLPYTIFDGYMYFEANPETVNICPEGWTILSVDIVDALQPEMRAQLFGAIGLAPGLFNKPFPTVVGEWTLFIPNDFDGGIPGDPCVTGSQYHIHSGEFQYGGLLSYYTYRFDLRCVKVL